jgi:hypothetical protein
MNSVVNPAFAHRAPEPTGAEAGTAAGKSNRKLRRTASRPRKEDLAAIRAAQQAAAVPKQYRSDRLDLEQAKPKGSWQPPSLELAVRHADSM